MNVLPRIAPAPAASPARTSTTLPAAILLHAGAASTSSPVLGTMDRNQLTPGPAVTATPAIVPAPSNITISPTSAGNAVLGKRKREAVTGSNSSELTTAPSSVEVNGAPEIKPEEALGGAIPQPANTTLIPPPKKGRGGKREGAGRKAGSGKGNQRKGSSSKIKEEDDGNVSSGSEIYTPQQTSTRSGRSVNKPNQFTPVVPSPTSAATTGGTGSARRKRPVVRRISESAVCRTCRRGYSPGNNLIVFCDGCNSAYHQFCHHPPIATDVIASIEAEWFCKACMMSREKTPKRGPVAKRQKISPQQPQTAVQQANTTAVLSNGTASSKTLSEEQKQAYFDSLDREQLISLLMKASNMHPDFPIFDSSITGKSAPPQPNTINGTSQPTQHDSSPATPLPPATSTPASQPAPDSHDSDREETNEVDPPAHYPKAGHGLKIPTDAQLEHFLVDDNTAVYSHFFPGDDMRMKVATAAA